jgi:hypothetical protein
VVTEAARCPVCGSGTLCDLSHDLDPLRRHAPPGQTADSLQVETYTCGHEVIGASLATADPDRLDVERRDSEETTTPLPERVDDSAERSRSR